MFDSMLQPTDARGIVPSMAEGVVTDEGAVAEGCGKGVGGEDTRQRTKRAKKVNHMNHMAH